jgi:hypothetical protein
LFRDAPVRSCRGSVRSSAVRRAAAYSVDSA